MLQIECPWCGPRDENEFSYGGEAHIVRPADPDALSDEEWADYLFMRSNTKGVFREQWCHSAGCRRWFNAERDTVTYRFKSIYKVGEQPPGEDDAG
jgi:sarcosine oxidase subunit delta